MSARRAPTVPRRQAGQCDSCAALADASVDLHPDDVCLRCGADVLRGPLCRACGDAPDVWAIALEASNA